MGTTFVVVKCRDQLIVFFSNFEGNSIVKIEYK